MWHRPFQVAFLLTFLVFHVVRADEPGVCPQDDGKYRSTKAGTFLITCFKRSGRGGMGPPNPETKATFAECIDACAARTGCKSVDYLVDKAQCNYLSGSFVPALDGSGTTKYHNARLATPPVTEPGPGDQQPITDGQPGGGSGAEGGGDQVGGPQGGGPQTGPPPQTGPQPLDSQLTQNPTCSEDDGKVFGTSDGTYYKLQCNYHSDRPTKLGESVEASFAACMEKCSATVGCNAVKYNARPPASGSGDPVQGTCRLWEEGGAAVDKCPTTQHDFAYAIDPPTDDDQSEFPNQLCTTECPGADGMTYASSYGETFRMDCGKRHGTKVLSTAYANSFRDCMEICAAMVPCHSVDYQPRSRKCYLGSHHGNPLVIASSYVSAHSLGCANACSEDCCGRASKDNRKPVFPPDTAPDTTRPDTSCGNQGLEYAIYDGPSTADWEPANYDHSNTQVVGKTSKVGIAAATSLYGNTPKDPAHVVVNHRGYLYAKQAGDYQFKAPACDDNLFFWIGDKAFSGFNKANADLTQAYVAAGAAAKFFTKTLEKGKYYPIRLIWGNTMGGAGNFQFEITAPDGSIVLDSKSGSSEYLVRFSCDGTSAPRYPHFGASDRPDTSCGNQGLEYALYDGPTADGWDPIKYNTGATQAVGKTTTLGISDAHNIYRKTPKDYGHVAVNHRGYLYAKQTGEYTFSSPSCDNGLYFWIGSKAFSGFNKANADIDQGWVSGGKGSKMFKMKLDKGKYYPVRLIWGNFGGPGNFQFDIKAPDGSVVLDSKSGSSDYFVRFSCDETSGPRYADPWAAPADKSP